MSGPNTTREVVPERESRGVTELKTSVEALQRIRSYLDDGQRLTKTGSWAWNPKTRENLFWSLEIFRIFGFTPAGDSPEFLFPISFWQTIERVHPDDRIAFQARLEQGLREKKDFERDFRVLLPDGTLKYIHSFVHPVFDSAGEVCELIGTAMDVTERKLADSLLTAEKRVLELIARGSPLAAVLNQLCSAADEQAPGLISTILLMDKDERRLWPAAGPHMPAAWTELITPLAIGPNAGSCGTAAYRREPVIVTDIAADPLWRGYADAAESHGLRACWSTPIRSTAGKVLGTFALYYGKPHRPEPRDLQLIDRATHLAQIAIERDRTQESLRETQLNLARVARITTVGELTAAIAHEVNQPLAAIETNADACLRGLGADPPDLKEARLAASWIAEDAERTAAIIRHVRDLLRKEQAVFAAVDLNGLVREVLPLVQPEAAKHGVSLQTDLPPGLPVIAGDKIELEQVVLNLVLNAIDAIAGLESGPRVVRIRTERAGPEEIVVAVSDTGAGLAEGEKERLFKAFYTTKPNGLGMGLSISRTIIESHGGRIWVEPNRERGVTFRFALPVGSGETL